MNVFKDKTVAFSTLGCKLNFSETSSISKDFVEAGFNIVNNKEEADVYVINTCSVTNLANKKSRQEIKRINKLAPESQIIAIGCYSQLKPEEVSQISGVDMVLGAKDKFKILEYLSKNLDGNKTVMSCDINDVDEFVPTISGGDRTRSFLKVQDGCDYKCTYCTIPMARGKSRNNTIASTIEQAKKIAESGTKEIVLTGINIGDFGKTTGETFFDLLKALAEVNGIFRYRISSIEPNLLTDEIIEYVAEHPKFMPHFHIPLQSGSNEVLKLMKRRYQRELYADRVAKIKSILPDAFIGCDVIVGMRGETEEYFDDCYNFLKELDISQIHVFTYSERENTKALEIKESVPVEERKRRSVVLHKLSDEKLDLFYEKYKDKTLPVLFENSNNGGKMSGFTDNYIKVSTEFNSDFTNSIIDVNLKSVNEKGAYNAEIIKK